MLTRLLHQLEALVKVESPSSCKAACNAVLDLVTTWAAEFSSDHLRTIRRHRHKDFGDSLELRFGPRRSAHKPILLLGHVDTVWPIGTLRTMPWRATRTRISGPGVLDMKAGIAMAFAALRLLAQTSLLQRPITLLLHSDEEVGSLASRSVTEAVAQSCQAVYVLEPAQGPQAAYKTARKGVGHYRLHIQGVSAHSGVDFTAGHSAIVELAHQIEAISALTDLDRGLTVNPGVISGGTLSNVVAAEASVEIDVRIARTRDGAHIHRQLSKLKPRDRGCQLTLSGGINRPPMERSRAIAALFHQAQRHAAAIGFALDEAYTGGGSDGNFTAALGVPTLDGMGAVGAGAHAPQEYLLPQHLVPRTILLAAMCTHIGVAT